MHIEYAHQSQKVTLQNFSQYGFCLAWTEAPFALLVAKLAAQIMATNAGAQFGIFFSFSQCGAVGAGRQECERKDGRVALRTDRSLSAAASFLCASDGCQQFNGKLGATGIV